MASDRPNKRFLAATHLNVKNLLIILFSLVAINCFGAGATVSSQNGLATNLTLTATTTNTGTIQGGTYSGNGSGLTNVSAKVATNVVSGATLTNANFWLGNQPITFSSSNIVDLSSLVLWDQGKGFPGIDMLNSNKTSEASYNMWLDPTSPFYGNVVEQLNPCDRLGIFGWFPTNVTGKLESYVTFAGQVQQTHPYEWLNATNGNHYFFFTAGGDFLSKPIGLPVAMSINGSNGIVSISNSVTLNAKIIGGTFYPSNTIYDTNYHWCITGPTRLSSPDGGFAALNIQEGDDIIITNISGTIQTTIINIVGTNALIEPPPSVTGVGTNVTFYIAFHHKDVIGAKAGWIGNDGTVAILGGVNSGRLLFGYANTTGSGTNVAWMFKPGANGVLNLLYTTNGLGQEPNVLQLDAQNGNNYEAIHIYPTGIPSTKWGFTNQSATVLQGTVTVTGGNLITGNGGGLTNLFGDTLQVLATNRLVFTTVSSLTNTLNREATAIVTAGTSVALQDTNGTSIATIGTIATLDVLIPMHVNMRLSGTGVSAILY